MVHSRSKSTNIKIDAFKTVSETYDYLFNRNKTDKYKKYLLNIPEGVKKLLPEYLKIVR